MVTVTKESWKNTLAAGQIFFKHYSYDFFLSYNFFPLGTGRLLFTDDPSRMTSLSRGKKNAKNSCNQFTKFRDLIAQKLSL